MDQYASDGAQNVLFDVSTMLHEFCLETRCADISKIKMEMFAAKKYNKEIVSVRGSSTKLFTKSIRNSYE